MTSWSWMVSRNSEYEHRTVSWLQGPQVNLTFRWVAQHIASCPLAGVVGCVTLLLCARFSRAGFPRVGGGVEKFHGYLFLGTGPPFGNPCVLPSGKHLDSQEEEEASSQ